MSDLEEQLRRLVIETCSHPPGSLKRQRGLTQIIRMTAGKLWKDNSPYYQDALQQTWVYFCQNICERTTADPYNPDRSSVATWLNAYLRRRLLDFFIEAQKQQAMRVQESNEQTLAERINPLENLPSPPDVPPILDDVRAWAEADPSGELSSLHIAGHPEITSQVLILRRLPPETSWKALSAEFGLPVSTLSSFYQRQCLPRLRKFGETRGYL